MSRTLHWFLLSGCAALISLFTPLAWSSLQVFRLPAEPAGYAVLNEAPLPAGGERPTAEVFAVSSLDAAPLPGRP